MSCQVPGMYFLESFFDSSTRIAAGIKYLTETKASAEHECNSMLDVNEHCRHTCHMHQCYRSRLHRKMEEKQ